MQLIYADANPNEWAYFIGEEESAKYVEADTGEFDERLSSNAAEYEAIIIALRRAIELELAGDMKLLSDSQLVINQINGIRHTRQAHLRRRVIQVWELTRKIKGNLTFRWVPRKANRAGKLLK